MQERTTQERPNSFLGKRQHKNLLGGWVPIFSCRARFQAGSCGPPPLAPPPLSALFPSPALLRCEGAAWIVVRGAAVVCGRTKKLSSACLENLVCVCQVVCVRFFLCVCVSARMCVCVCVRCVIECGR